MGGVQLRVTEGKERGKRLRVDSGLLIGRAATQEDGRLGDDPEISRRHAQISRQDGGRLTIEDLGSANGTFVNGERIGAVRTLGLGDVVRMGKTVLQVTDDTGAVPDKTRPPAASGGAHARIPEAADELVVTAGTPPGRRLTVTDELLLGRGVRGVGRFNDDPRLSRRHARVTRDAGGQLAVEDLGSVNGTFVNGKRVRGRQVLKVGDSVEVGSTTLKVTTSAPAPGSAARTTPPTPVAAPPGAPPAGVGEPPGPVRRTPGRAKRSPELAAPDPALGRLASQFPPGSIVAGCRLDEVIGHGDMGVVYRAEELALQRLVALKLILPEHSGDERFRERFRRESSIAAAIDHPNVIPIFDAGEEGGVLFIMMRIVEGTDLRELIAGQQRIEPLRVARIVRQVGAALDAAHARGMVHRDVKPANVLLAREDHVYLSDFGLARRAASAGGLTRQGSIMARAAYVAPEQILDQRVDARADIYALGCLLFEALTGEPPYARWTDGPQALAHLNAPPPSPVELCPELPREFDDVVRRAMAKDPNDRFPSAGDLGQAALVAGGGLRRARAESIVAIGDAAPVIDTEPEKALSTGPTPGSRADTPPGHFDALRWAIACAGLAIVFVGMVAALRGIASL